MTNKFRQIQEICLGAPSIQEALERQEFVLENYSQELRAAYFAGVTDGKALGQKELSDEIIAKVFPDLLKGA